MKKLCWIVGFTVAIVSLSSCYESKRYVADPPQTYRAASVSTEGYGSGYHFSGVYRSGPTRWHSNWHHRVYHDGGTSWYGGRGTYRGWTGRLHRNWGLGRW
jgi:hypothetical protein